MDDRNKSAFALMFVGILTLICGFLVYLGISKLVTPLIEESFDTLNFIAMTAVVSVVPLFIVKLFTTYALVKCRYFLEGLSLQVVDGLIPIWSDIKLYKAYMILVSDVYIIDENGYIPEGSTRAKGRLVSFIGKLSLILMVLFYFTLVAGGIYLYVTLGMYMLTIPHVLWFGAMLIIYNISLAVRGIMFGIVHLAFSDYVLSYNPRRFIVQPLIIPIISFGYSVISLVTSIITGSPINQPLLNFIAFAGIILIEPLVIAWNTRITINEVKMTVDEETKKALERGEHIQYRVW